jgi:lauroyl/myristoyl acyltransferase
MLDFFDNSLRSFLQSGTPGVGSSPAWLVTRIRRWSATPEWSTAARRLRPTEQVEVFAELGRRVFDSDLANYRTDLELNTRRVACLGSARRRRELLREHCAFLFISLLDALVLSDERARDDVLRDVEVRGVEQGDASLAAGRGAILLGCLQTHSGFGLRHPRLAHWKFGVVRHQSATDGYPLGWAEKTYGENVDFVPTTSAGVERLFACLKARGCVAVQNDFSYPQTIGLPGTLFGRPVLVSRSLVKLILRTRAPVLPVNVVRLEPFASRRIRVEIHPPLPLDDLTESKEDQRIAALRLSVATECLIRRYPVQWTHWTLLEYRWREAEAAFAKRAEAFLPCLDASGEK